MRIEVIGNGGREDAIRWKLRLHGHEVDVTFPEFTVVGPEKELAGGIVDRYNVSGKPIVGPTKLAARLESSKLWAKQFMQRWDIPTARWMTYTRNPDGMNQALSDLDIMRNNRPHKIVSVSPLDLENPYYPVVIKEDGLCGGKGVVIARTQEEAWRNIPPIFITNIFNSVSNKVLFEDFVPGFEASCFVMCDKFNYKILPFCKDYKKAQDGDIGLNTGGMGAITPHPYVTEKMKKIIEDTIVKPTLTGMRFEHLNFKGILYIGLMINETGPYVIEYNVRLGDPECQVLMMQMEDDLAPYLEAITKDTLDKLPDPKFYQGASVTTTLCSQGYPKEFVHGHEITGLDTVDDAVIFHAATELDSATGKYKTAGGRVLNVTARDTTLDLANKKVYKAIENINYDNMIYRKDIGNENSRNKNKVATWNQRRTGRNNTDQCRKRFKNHSHFGRAGVLPKN